MSLTQEIIRKKRDRQALSRDEIGEFVRGVVDGSVANGVPSGQLAISRSVSSSMIVS